MMSDCKYKHGHSILDIVLSKQDIIIILILFLFSYFIYTRIYAIQVDSLLHVSFILDKIEKNILFFPVSYNSFFQWLIYFFGFGRSDFVFQTLPFILALSFTSKYIIFRYIIVDYLSFSICNFKDDSIYRLISLLACFSFHILTLGQISTNWYLGGWPSCVWHNPTVIFVIPFSMLFFYYSYKFILNKSIFLGMIVSILLIINMFSKPAFLMPAFPVFIIFLFINSDENGNIYLRFSSKILIYMFPFVLMIGILFLYLYNLIFKDTGLVFSFPYAWKFLSISKSFAPMFDMALKKGFHINFSNGFMHCLIIIAVLFIRLIFSNLFYFLSLFLLKKRNLLINIYAFFIWILGFLILFFINEKQRPDHGNFSWQVFICNTILFIPGLINLISYHYNNPDSKLKNISIFEVLSYSALSLQFYCGILYMFRIILNGAWL